MIEEGYGGRLTTSAKGYLVEEGYLDSYIAHRVLDTDIYDKLRRIFPLPTTKRTVPTETVEWNLAYCVSGLLALKARREPQVVGFRTDHLRGKPLPQDKIESWITRISKREGTRTVSRQLVFWSEASQGVTSIFVVDGGVLDQLRHLSRLLAHAYGWQLAQASSFALSDVTPIVESIEVGAEIYPDHPFRSRVTLKVDPSMSPKEVANAYIWSRNEHFEKRRRQGLKTQTLALFHAQHVVYAERKEKWGVLLEKWNDMCTSAADWEESWKYDTASALTNFRRDSQKTYGDFVMDRHKGVGKEVSGS